MTYPETGRLKRELKQPFKVEKRNLFIQLPKQLRILVCIQVELLLGVLDRLDTEDEERRQTQHGRQ